MRHNPLPLYVYKGFDGAGRSCNRVPRHNCVHGRVKVKYRCQQCGEVFFDRAVAVEHSAKRRHVVQCVEQTEICPVDLDDDWIVWEDGAGVSFTDRAGDRFDDLYEKGNLHEID